MVFLSRTKYPVENGLQTIFNDNDTDNSSLLLLTGVQEKITNIQEKYNTAVVFLVFSLVWSFKTATMTAIKIKADTKTFLPFKSKLLLGWRYLVVYMVRIGCIVAGMCVFIGGLGIMNHYHAENIHLNPEIWKRFNPSSKFELLGNFGIHYSLIPEKLQKLCASQQLAFRTFPTFCFNNKWFDFFKRVSWQFLKYAIGTRQKHLGFFAIYR